jgi:hypothetical protein
MKKAMSGPRSSAPGPGFYTIPRCPDALRSLRVAHTPIAPYTARRETRDRPPSQQAKRQPPVIHVTHPQPNAAPLWHTEARVRSSLSTHQLWDRDW